MAKVTMLSGAIKDMFSGGKYPFSGTTRSGKVYKMTIDQFEALERNYSQLLYAQYLADDHNHADGNKKRLTLSKLFRSLVNNQRMPETEKTA